MWHISRDPHCELLLRYRDAWKQPSLRHDNIPCLVLTEYKIQHPFQLYNRFELCHNARQYHCLALCKILKRFPTWVIKNVFLRDFSLRCVSRGYLMFQRPPEWRSAIYSSLGHARLITDISMKSSFHGEVNVVRTDEEPSGMAMSRAKPSNFAQTVLLTVEKTRWINDATSKIWDDITYPSRN